MSTGRILIVDDDPQIRRVLKVTLTGQGYEVDDAKSGESALEKVRDRRFDLVLLDMNMPGMDGLETCRAIRERSEIGIIMLTVRDNEADAVEALDAGADDYVTKPFKPSELSARIRAALRRTPSTHGPSGRLTLGTVDAQGVRAAQVPGDPREQGTLASRASAGCLGSRLRRPGRLPSGDCQSAEKEDRSQAGQSRLPLDRTVGRLPAALAVRPAIKNPNSRLMTF
jgi:DNA-binding response OmpR family regulator